MIFNERGRTTTTIESLSTTKNAAVAFQLTQADAALAAAHGRIDWTRADVWEDLNLGTQYLVEGLDSSRMPRGTYSLFYLTDFFLHQSAPSLSPSRTTAGIR